VAGLALLFDLGSCRRGEPDPPTTDPRAKAIATDKNAANVHGMNVHDENARGGGGGGGDQTFVVVRDGSTIAEATPRSQPEAVGPAWASWPIPSPPAMPTAHPQDYDTSNKPVVLDRVTGRMWQRFVESKTRVWNEARDYCDRLDLGGYSDWRLPSRVELLSIVDLTHSQPSINQTAFPKTPSDWFWTSSVDAENPTTAAWYVYFYFGYPKTYAMSNQFRVRCVRAPPVSDQHDSSAPQYDVRKESVHDRGTGLTWQRLTPTRSFDFESARQYCAKLRLDQHGGWRVPSAGELLTLVDERRTNPTIEIRAFPHTTGQSFWTSSLFADSAAMAWHVYFESGNSLYGLLKGSYRVRCVQ
jgi:hypothetical protein